MGLIPRAMWLVSQTQIQFVKRLRFRKTAAMLLDA
jgi:hypothetical protein